MIVVVQLLLVVALATLVKLGTRRLFGGRGRDEHKSDSEAKGHPSSDVAPRGKPKPTARTNGPGKRQR